MCTSLLSDFTICPSCGKGFCGDHTFPNCPFCKVGTQDASAVVETRFRSWEISWLNIGPVRFGLAGFTEIPSISSEVLTHLRNNVPKIQFEIILFPSKKLSNTFRSSFSPRPFFQNPNIDDPDEASRFSVAFGPGDGIRSILLNAAALEPRSVNFVLSLLLAREYDVRPTRAMIGSRKIGQTILAALTEYNKKLGIPFVASNAHTLESHAIFVNHLNQSYNMFMTLRAIVSEDNLEEAAYFVEKHVDLVFGQMKWEIIHLLDESLNLLWKTIEALTVMAGVSRQETLRTRMAVVMGRHLDTIRGKLANYPDAMRAIHLVINRLSGDECYATRDLFIEAACGAFLESVTQFGPNFDRTDEILELMLHVRKVSAKLEEEGSDQSRFGSVTKTLELLDEIFERRDIYPEIPIHAGQALFTLLETMMLSGYDYAAYRQALVVGRKLSSLIERNYDEVKRLNPHSPYTKEDFALPLLVLVAAAETFDDLTEAANLREEVRAVVDRHHLLRVKCQLDWRAFLETQDFDFLMEIYKDFQKASTTDTPGIADHANFVGNLSSAVFEREQRDSHLNLARDYALDMGSYLPPTQDMIKLYPQLQNSRPGPISVFLAENAGTISLYFAELFGAVLDLGSDGVTTENIKKARQFSEILDGELSSHHPAHILVLRTLCLCDLLERNLDRLEAHLRELEERAGSEKRVQGFIHLCRLWTATERFKLKLLKSLESDTDSRDPWSQIASQFVNSELKSVLKKVDIFDYDALVFVEGKYDEEIFPRLAKRVRPDLNLLFIGMQGWTSMDYYAETQTATKADRQVVVIFDGDTDANRSFGIKARLISGLKGKPLILTLKRNSIEDYLLVPRCVKAAVPSLSLDERDIASFLDNTVAKKNKKLLLDELLKKHAGVKYDGEIGAKIASEMKLEEIEPEIRSIFANLRNYGISRQAENAQLVVS